jgi:O-antigen/teichoic acid export membrane protein
LIVAGYGAIGALGGVVVALGAGAVFALWLSYRSLPFSLWGPVRSDYAELIQFSLPLMFAASTGFIVSNTDTVLLGVFSSAGSVGLYNTAFQIQQLGRIFFYPVAFLLPPVITRLQQRNHLGEINKTYRTSTKWMVIGTFPVIVLLLSFPEFVIRMSFGPKYVSAATALRILAVPVFVTVFFGANGASLIALGHNHINMYVNGCTAVLNIVLNILLIPQLGIVGAAIASAAAFVFRDATYTTALYRWHGVHPFSGPVIRVLMIVATVTVPVHVGFTSISPVNIISVIALAGIFVVGYSIVLIRASVFSQSDLQVIENINESVGVNLNPMKTLFRRLSD